MHYSNSSQKPNCKVCNSITRYFRSVDFNKSGNDYFIGKRTFPKSKTQVLYYRCENCGLVMTDFFDKWTGLDFKEKVYNEEYLKADPPFVMERPAKLIKIFSAIFNKMPLDTKILDYGGGQGTLVKLLQDLGFQYAENFDPFYGHQKTSFSKYDIVLSFEVVEHIPNQLEFWSQMRSYLNKKGILLFTTLINTMNENLPAKKLWYLCPRNGHVVMHSKKSLELIINSFGLNLISLNDEVHLAFYEMPDVMNLGFPEIPSVFSEKLH